MKNKTFKPKFKVYDNETKEPIVFSFGSEVYHRVSDRYSKPYIFTGFVDGEGVEVFEGDMLIDQYEGVVDTVVWTEDFQFCTENNIDSDQSSFSLLRIVGNVVQTPNLSTN